MKTNLFKATFFGMVILFFLSVITFSCQKENIPEDPKSSSASNDQNVQSEDPAPESIIAKAEAEAATAPYNLNVLLLGNRGLGFLKFRQNPDTARVINLDTWLFHLKPNHTYLLQRAVNPIADPTQCSSTAWLTLGLGLTPQAIHTNRFGFGFQPLWRNVSSVARGTAFYIHFQIIDSLTSQTVLTSDCNTFAVR